MERTFLYKIINSDDRDCCVYIDNSPLRFECGHYFGGVILQGACFSNCEWANYTDIKTVLTETEYNELQAFSAAIEELGHGIVVGSERYQAGIQLCKNIQYVYDKLNSAENNELFEVVQKEEIEWMMERYSFDEEDIGLIFCEYRLEYRDRSIVGSVFADAEEFGYEMAWSYGYISQENTIMQQYFDAERFGEDLLEEEYYIQLHDGRIVSLNY